jgi:hypothetical protein
MQPRLDPAGHVASPGSLPPPFIPSEVKRAMLNPAIDLRPWAAYQLGYESQALRADQIAFWEQPREYLPLQDNVPPSDCYLQKGDCYLQKALTILAPDIPPRVSVRINGVLDKLCRLNGKLSRQWELAGGHPGPPFGDGSAPGEGLWWRLVYLAKQALDQRHPNRPWFELGWAFGRWWRLSAHTTNPRLRLRAVWPIVKAAGRLPPSEVRGQAALQTLADLAAAPRNGATLRELVRRCWALWPPEYAEPGYGWGLTSIIMSLDEQVCRHLVRLPCSPVTAPEPSRPRWDAAQGVLLYEDRVVRKVRPFKVATNIIQVLQAFETAGWPRQIEDPVRLGQQTLHETIRSLNKALRIIRFHSDGTGERIRWEVTRQ